MKILVASSNSIGSILIKLFTFSSWSHTAVMFDEHTVIDSIFKCGVRRITLSEFKHEYPKVYEIDVDIPDEYASKDFALRQLGKKYDFTAILGIIFRNRKWEEDDKWFCAELTETICVKGGLRRMRTEASSVLPRETFAVLGGINE